MLALRRRNELPNGRGEILYSSLSRPGLRVYVARSRGVLFDTRVLGPALPRRDRSALSQVAIPLEGHYLVRRGGDCELGAREIFAEGGFPWDERWSGDAFAVLVVEWDATFGDLLSQGTIAPVGSQDRARLQAFGSALERSGPGLVEAVPGVLGLLRSLGLPITVPTALALREGIPQSARALVGTLEDLESRLESQPMWCDLEAKLGRSSRHLRRQRDQVLTALGRPTGETFRSWMQRLRVRTAAAFMTAEGATVEQVARAVGYGSARALILAMHQAGLPSPGALRALARDEDQRRR